MVLFGFRPVQLEPRILEEFSRENYLMSIDQKDIFPDSFSM